MFPKKWGVRRRRPLGRCWKRHASDLALGIERIGLASLRFPRAVGLLALVLAVFCGFGITRIKIAVAGLGCSGTG
jgi:hypothetical protein